MKVFISHASEDQAIALAIKSYLESIFLNAEVFVSGRDLTGGEVWIEQLLKKLDDSTAIIALVTRFSKDSKWVHFESGAGFTSNKTIPLVADGVNLQNLQAPFRLLQARRLDTEGLRNLARDFSRLGGLREPDKFPTLEETLADSESFIHERADRGGYSKPSIATSSTAGFSGNERAQDLSSRNNALLRRAEDALRRALETRRPTFDLPSKEEITDLGFSDLRELAATVGIPNSCLNRKDCSLFKTICYDMAP